MAEIWKFLIKKGFNEITDKSMTYQNVTNLHGLSPLKFIIDHRLAFCPNFVFWQNPV